MGEKAALMKIAVNSGVHSIDAIINTYNKYAEGGPIKSYKDFSTRLSKTWGNQDLSKDDYDYEKYYNDNPTEAYRQLEAIEHGSKAHFPDEGKSGTYKTPNHPTYPDLGSNSWINDRVFNMSERQFNQGLDNLNDEINTDRVLDYLGSDIDYNKGGTTAKYNDSYLLPSVTVTKDRGYTELIPNELGTGWMYRDRAGRYSDFNYDYVNKFGGGGYKPSASIKKRISNWEGSTMKTNRSFEDEARSFNISLPKGATSKLTQQQLDGLYSYSYNVGAGTFKKRVSPILTKYLAGQATIKDVQDSMWASKDSKLRGLAKRREIERGMLGSYIPEVPIAPVEVEIPPLQFNELIGNTPSDIPTIDFNTDSPILDTEINSDQDNMLGIFNLMKMFNAPKDINIYT